MKTNKGRFSVKTSVGAVRCALLAMAIVPAAYAADKEAVDPDVAALTQPTNSVEAGVEYVNNDSAKFGEYNGLNKKGAYGILNLDVRGGGYGSSEDATRWKIIGTDLGLDTRSLTGDYGQQGKFRIDLGYDELRRNRSDTYQTPYLGAGGNLFTLPSNWLPPRVPQVSATAINFRSFSPSTGLAPALVNGVSTPPTAAQQATVNNILANDVPAFQNVDLYTKRERYDGGFTYLLNPQWEFKGSVRHEDKTGYKPMGTVTSQVSEFSATLPDPIDQSTDQYNLSATFTGAKGFFQVAYYGSIFKNNVQSLTWQDVNDLDQVGHDGQRPGQRVPPDRLTGGYKFSPTTKLVANGSMARGTQNETFLTGAQNNQLPLGVPAQSLNGLVVSKIVQPEAHVAADEGPQHHGVVQVRRPRQPHADQHLHLPGRQRGARRGGLAVQLRARARGEHPRQQHQHLQQPPLQQDAEPGEPGGELPHRQGPVDQRGLRVPEDRPRLHGLLDRLRRREHDQGEHRPHRMEGRPHREPVGARELRLLASARSTTTTRTRSSRWFPWPTSSAWAARRPTARRSPRRARSRT